MHEATARGGARLLGLVRGLDQGGSLHRYVVGERATGPAGELGAIRSRPRQGSVPVWRGVDGRVFTEPGQLVPIRPRVGRLARWILEPLWRREASSSRGRARIVAGRMVAATQRPWRVTSAPRNPLVPLGYLEGDARPHTRPLFASVHPVVGDQLLSTREGEAAELGYAPPTMLGHLVAAAPTTGILWTTAPQVPVWASRSGTRHHEHFAASGRITQPRGPEPIAADTFKVAGWALLAGEGVATVDVLADGRPVGRGRPGLPRPNASEAWQSPDRFVAGFDAYIEKARLQGPDDSVEIEALVTGLEGTQVVVTPSEPVTLTRGRSYESSSAPTPSVRPGRRSTRARDRRRGPLHLLALTHRLDIGGAQRYLAEQLIRLVHAGGVRATVVSPVDGEWRDPLEEAGIEVEIIDGYGTQTLAGYERALEELLSWARAESFDVALVNTLDAFAGADLAERLGLPAAWTIHESFELPVWWATQSQGEGDPGVRARLERALALTPALLFVADSTRRLFERRGRDERMLTTPHGLDLEGIEQHRRVRDRAATRRRLGIAEDTLAVLCLGVVDPRKAQLLLARAFAEVCERHPSAHLYVVGASPASPSCDALEAFVAAFPMADRCTIVPVTSDAYSWHAAADIFALPSSVESSPISMKEAMAFETPVMASRVFGIPEIITDGRDGYLFEPNDAGDLRKALDRVLGASAEERRSVGLAGAARVARLPDANTYAASLRRLLEGLADDPAAAPVWEGGSPPETVDRRTAHPVRLGFP